MGYLLMKQSLQVLFKVIFSFYNMLLSQSFINLWNLKNKLDASSNVFYYFVNFNFFSRNGFHDKGNTLPK
jgi:hypothetical protein